MPTTAPRMITWRAPGGMCRPAIHEYTPTPVVPSTAPQRKKTMKRGRSPAPNSRPPVSRITAITVTRNSSRSSSSAGSLLLSQRGRNDVRGADEEAGKAGLHLVSPRRADIGGDSSGRSLRRPGNRRRSLQLLDERFQLAQVAALVHAVGVRAVVPDDRVTGVPVALRLGVQPVDVASLGAHLLDHP